MILKGSQRSGGADLASHLLNGFDNESVVLVDTRGTVATDLHGAFAEFEATAAGTRCKEPFYSLSINPPVQIDRAAYFAAIDRIEQRLKLEGQPRAVVFHVKDGREHCHVVWSRIHADGDRLKAIHMSHDRSKLAALSCDFFRELGIPLPEGLAAWEAKQPDRHLRQDYTRAEKEQSEATGITVAERRKAITEAFRGSDSAETFRAALEAAGYVLATGDKRAFVVVDDNAQIFSLSRQIEGATSRDVKAKLAGLAGVPDVQKAKAILKERAQARADRVREDAKAFADRQRFENNKRRREQTIIAFLDRIRTLKEDAKERLALKAKHQAELKALEEARASAIRRALARVPGISALIRFFEQRTDLSLIERQRQEREALQRRQEIRHLRLDRADVFLEKVAVREEKALAVRAMAKAIRRAVHQARKDLAEGRISAMPKHGFVDPNGMSTEEWYRAQKRNAADMTDRKDPHARQQQSESDRRAMERHEQAKADARELRRKVHEMRRNGADITHRHQPIGTIDTRAADIFAAIHRDETTPPQTPGQGTTTSRDAPKGTPRPPSQTH